MECRRHECRQPLRLSIHTAAQESATEDAGTWDTQMDREASVSHALDRFERVRMCDELTIDGRNVCAGDQLPNDPGRDPGGRGEFSRGVQFRR